jgi:glycosyltransferase involved in cell wall biosynthesis
MRLILLTQYYPPEIGAPQRRLSELAARFVRRGHEVFVLTAMPSYPKGRIYPGYGGLYRKEVLDGITIVRSFIYPSQRTDHLHRLANYFSFVLSALFVGVVSLPRADYVMVESPPLFLGVTGMLLSFFKRARMIFNVSDLWPESVVRLGVLRRESMAFRVTEWLEAFCYRRAWLVSGQSKSIVSDILHRFPRLRTHHLSNGVDTGMFSPQRRTTQVRKTLGDDDQCVALYAGLHGLAQGLDQILAAAEMLKADCPCRFVLIGDGPEKQMLVKQAAEKGLTNVVFRNSLAATNLPEIVASADLVVVTLKLHIPGAVPSKLYEAMASGQPVVMVAEGEPAEIVERFHAGIVVPPGDIQGLARAVRTLCASPELRMELGSNGRRAVEEHFDRENIVARFILHLEGELMDAGARASVPEQSLIAGDTMGNGQP